MVIVFLSIESYIVSLNKKKAMATKYIQKKTLPLPGVTYFSRACALGLSVNLYPRTPRGPLPWVTGVGTLPGRH